MLCVEECQTSILNSEGKRKLVENILLTSWDLSIYSDQSHFNGRFSMDYDDELRMSCAHTGDPLREVILKIYSSISRESVLGAALNPKSILSSLG